MDFSIIVLTFILGLWDLLPVIHLGEGCNSGKHIHIYTPVKTEFLLRCIITATLKGQEKTRELHWMSHSTKTFAYNLKVLINEYQKKMSKLYTYIFVLVVSSSINILFTLSSVNEPPLVDIIIIQHKVWLKTFFQPFNFCIAPQEPLKGMRMPTQEI